MLGHKWTSNQHLVLCTRLFLFLKRFSSVVTNGNIYIFMKLCFELSTISVLAFRVSTNVHLLRIMSAFSFAVHYTCVSYYRPHLTVALSRGVFFWIWDRIGKSLEGETWKGTHFSYFPWRSTVGNLQCRRHRNPQKNEWAPISVSIR